jgi:ankyrin repeat protein
MQEQRYEIPEISMDIFEDLRKFFGSKPSKTIKTATAYYSKNLEEIRKYYSEILRCIKIKEIDEETVIEKLNSLYDKFINTQYKEQEAMRMIGENITIKIFQNIIYIVSHYIEQVDCKDSSLLIINNIIKFMQRKELLITRENIYQDYKTGNIFLHSLLGYNDIEKHYVEHIKNIFDKNFWGKALFYQDNSGNTILHIICKKGNLEAFKNLRKELSEDILKKLLQVENNLKFTALHYTSAQGYDFLTSRLIKHTKYIHTLLFARTHKEMSALHLACMYGHTEVVKTLLRTVKEISQLRECLKMQNDYCMTALHLACKEGHTEVVNKLINILQEGWLNKFLMMQSGCKMTAFHLACMYGHDEVVEILLKMIISDKNQLHKLLVVQDNHEMTALHLACKEGHTEVVNKLINILCQKGWLKEFLKMQDSYQMTALHLACKEGHTEVVNKLINILQEGWLNEFLIMQDDYQMTTFHLACKNGHHKVVELLLSKIEESQLWEFLKMQNDYRMTALHSACQNGHTRVVDILLRSITKEDQLWEFLTMQDSQEMTAFHIACQKNNNEIIIKFINKYIKTMKQIEFSSSKQQITVNGERFFLHTNYFNKTFLVTLCEMNNITIIKLLIERFRTSFYSLNRNFFFQLLVHPKLKYTPLKTACIKGNIAISHLILKELDNLYYLIQAVLTKNNYKSVLEIIIEKIFELQNSKQFIQLFYYTIVILVDRNETSIRKDLNTENIGISKYQEALSKLEKSGYEKNAIGNIKKRIVDAIDIEYLLGILETQINRNEKSLAEPIVTIIDFLMKIFDNQDFKMCQEVLEKLTRLKGQLNYQEEINTEKRYRGIMTYSNKGHQFFVKKRKSGRDYDPTQINMQFNS